jgi:hypothetical protein
MFYYSLVLPTSNLALSSYEQKSKISILWEKSIDLHILAAVGLEWGKSDAYFQKNLTIWTNI